MNDKFVNNIYTNWFTNIYKCINICVKNIYGDKYKKCIKIYKYIQIGFLSLFLSQGFGSESISMS